MRSQTTTNTKLKPLTQSKHELLNENGGCYKCRRPFVYHCSGECTAGFPLMVFTVNKAYIESLKRKESKPKVVAAVFDRLREEKDSRFCGCLSSKDHRCYSASPHCTDSCCFLCSPSPAHSSCPGRRSSVNKPRYLVLIEYAETEGVAAFHQGFQSTSLSPGRHSIAVVLGFLDNPVAYIPSNEDDILSMGAGSNSASHDSNKVCVSAVAAVDA